MNGASHGEIWSLPANPEFIIFESPRSSWAGRGSKYLIWIQPQIMVEKILPSIGWLCICTSFWRWINASAKWCHHFWKSPLWIPGDETLETQRKKIKCFGLVSHANSSDLITGINKMTKRSDKDYFYFFAQSVCRMRPTGEERKEKKTAFYAN